MPDLVIGDLREDEIDAAVELWRTVNLTRPWNDPYADARLAMAGATSAILAGRLGGRLVATVMVGADGHRGWVYYLAVSPDCGGRHYGEAMMRAAERWIIARGMPKLQLMVRKDNALVIGFYEAIGYQQEAVAVLSRRLEGAPPSEAVELLTEDLDDEAVFAAVRARFESDRATPAYRRAFEVDDPLVSVCITTADRGELLAQRALASMTQQTYKNLQVIVIGDCCEDDTAERVAALNDPRFQFVNLPTRGPYPHPGFSRWLVAGTYPANAALRLVRGQFVTHIDEDDTFAPNRIEVLLRAALAGQADVMHHPFYWENDDRSWSVLGNGEFALGQTGTSMVLYHHWFARIPWDLFAYRKGEPGDWNRFRKFAALGARIGYLPEPLTRHWKFPARGPFVAKANEEFLDEGPQG